MLLGEARTPDNTRLYAIGDVHGCIDQLEQAHEIISGDLAERPVGDHRIIHLGDYVDRGPDSKAVIERLADLTADDPRVVCLLGNHDALMRDFITAPLENGHIWLNDGGGGRKTLEDYGIDTRGWRNSNRVIRDLSQRFGEVLPVHHRQFLDDRPTSIQFGDFFFCHAGIRPGIPLDRQSEEDLTWIRQEFLDDPRDHGVVVVHGHTPAKAPEIKPNRINIDTGAVFGHALTVLVLEGGDHLVFDVV